MEELWSALWAPQFPGRMHAMIQPQTAPQAKKWGLTSFAVTRQRDPRVRVWHQMIACKVLPKSCRTAIATLSICVVCVPRVIVGGPARGALEPGSTRGSLLYIGLHLTRSNLSQWEQRQMSALHGFRWIVVAPRSLRSTVGRWLLATLCAVCWPPRSMGLFASGGDRGHSGSMSPSYRAARMRHSPRARGTVDLSARMYKVTHRISPSHCSPTTSTLAPYKRVFQPSQCPNQLGGPRPWLRAPAPTIDHACGADALGKGGLLSVARKSFRPR